MTLEYLGIDSSRVGQCDVDMIVSQIPANSDGFVDNLGTARYMPDNRYTFQVTIDPCQPILTSVVPPPDMTYTLGDSNINQSYQIDQTPNCYVETVSMSPSESWLSVNSGSSQIDLNLASTYDRNLIGDHVFTLTKSISVPDDHTLTSYSTVEVEEQFTVHILDPCLTTTIDPIIAVDMYTIVD